MNLIFPNILYFIDYLTVLSNSEDNLDKDVIGSFCDIIKSNCEILVCMYMYIDLITYKS